MLRKLEHVLHHLHTYKLQFYVHVTISYINMILLRFFNILIPYTWNKCAICFRILVYSLSKPIEFVCFTKRKKTNKIIKTKLIHLYSDPFSPEAVKHREEMVLKAAQNSQNSSFGAQANLNEGRSYHQLLLFNYKRSLWDSRKKTLFWPVAN